MRHLFLLVLFLLAPLAPLHSAQEPPDAAVIANIAILRSAAEQGEAEAQYNLGYLYFKGQEVPQDKVEARKWFLKAAEQGYAAAQYRLGVLYDHGQGVAQDNTMAYVWYNLAVSQGHAEARDSRDLVAVGLDTASLAKAQTLSTEYFKLYLDPFQ